MGSYAPSPWHAPLSLPSPPPPLRSVEARNQLPAALLTYPALLTLWGLALATAVHLFMKTAPYNYA